MNRKKPTNFFCINRVRCLTGYTREERRLIRKDKNAYFKF